MQDSIAPPVRPVGLRALSFCLLTALAGAAHGQAAPRASKVGDVHSYAIQQKADRRNYDETVTIVAIENDRIRTRHVSSDRPEPTEGLFGTDWGTHKSGTTGMQMQPPSKVLSHPLEVGKAWEAEYEGTASTGGRIKVKMKSRVGAKETVRTPAGEFDAVRVDSEGYLNGLSFPGGWAIVQKVWYAPAIDRIVRLEYREQRSLGADTVVELKSFRPAD
jgi:hypothetical protein